jgi:hypothetical protein
MEGSGVSVNGVSLGRRDGPTSASQFPESRENNREFAKFPIVSAARRRQFVQQFQSPAGNSLHLLKRRILK